MYDIPTDHLCELRINVRRRSSYEKQKVLPTPATQLTLHFNKSCPEPQVYVLAESIVDGFGTASAG